MGLSPYTTLERFYWEWWVLLDNWCNIIIKIDQVGGEGKGRKTKENS